MTRRFRLFLMLLSMLSTLIVVGASHTPASACTGDVCDGICDFQNTHPSKLWPNGCQLR